MISVTAILLSWRRPDNMPRIVRALKREACAQVWLADNSGANAQLGEIPGVDRFWLDDNSLACSRRWQLAAEEGLETDYALMHDDDLRLGEGALARMVEASQGGKHVVGCAGRRLVRSQPYGRCSYVKAGACDLLLGRLMLVPKSQLALCWPNPEKFEDDIYANSRMTLPRVVLRGLVHELPPGDGVAVCDRPSHYAHREAARRRYFDR